MSVRIKRIIAFVIDWNIVLLPVVFMCSFLAAFLRQESSQKPFIALLCFLVILSAFGAFILRDRIFKGRSLGKRIFGLFVYDKSSLGQANARQLCLRNVFFFLYFIDGILLLATGRTIGDRVAGTLVTSEQELDSYAEDIHANPVSKKKARRKAILVLAIVIGCLIAFIGLIQAVLISQKNTEEYIVAYRYFTKSQAFKELNADESKIRFKHYSSHTYTPADGDSVSQTVEIGFIVNFKSFEIVCHKENGVWQVCDECTPFE